jgi:hypothetical protein
MPAFVVGRPSCTCCVESLRNPDKTSTWQTEVVLQFTDILLYSKTVFSTHLPVRCTCCWWSAGTLTSSILIYVCMCAHFPTLCWFNTSFPWTLSQLMNFCCRHIPCMQKPNYCLDYLDLCFIPVAMLTDNHHHMPCESFILCWPGQLFSLPLLLTSTEHCMAQWPFHLSSDRCHCHCHCLLGMDIAHLISKNILSLRHICNQH